MSNYKALIFDLDDTLLDFTLSEENSLNKLHAAFFSEFTLSHFKKTYHEINQNLWSLVPLQKIAPSELKIKRFDLLLSLLKLPHSSCRVAEHYEEALGKEVFWMPDAEEAILKFKQSHSIGIVTNGLTSVQEAKYKASGLENICKSFIISEKVGLSKPNKAIFDLALEELQVKPHEALMVGDSLESDFVGAINASLDFCWINPKKSALPSHLPQPRYEASSLKDLSNFMT